MEERSKERSSSRKNIYRISGIVLAVLIALLLPVICGFLESGAYYLNVINYIFVYTIASTGLNVMTGYSGQINLGGAAYFSVGAYAVVILCNAGVPTLLSVVLAMLVVAFFGFLTAVPAAKLKYHFLALATTAVGEVVNNLLTVSPGGITNDTHGMFVKALVLFGFKFKSDASLYYLLLIMTALCLLFTWAFLHSRTGRACVATRDSVDAAGSCGIDVRQYKIIATVVSCVMIGFAGFLFAYLNRYISPDTFAAGKSTMFMSMMMLGGSGTLFGPFLGAVLITLIMELLRGIQGSGPYMQLTYGFILLIEMMFMPQGVSGAISDYKYKKDRRRMEAAGGDGKDA
ncbi:MAG: branched-chain amino acid ABC transporter permease [Oscillospiraceae bacterium]|nr:branched-chain amino acid ABC transporter permease [Oscillospiraceae bacterium]